MFVEVFDVKERSMSRQVALPILRNIGGCSRQLPLVDFLVCLLFYLGLAAQS